METAMRSDAKHGGKDKNPKNFRCDDKLDVAIKNFQRQHNIHSQSEAIRELIKLGITYDYTQSLDD